jgi:tetratricopeptide (TPR) repeat protein/urea transporter/murein DD-endopeptidase MepM/ murein hydrolase activator NlpD
MDRVKSILHACAEIFFLQGSAAGAMLLAIALLCPRSALTGLIALAAAHGFVRLIGIEREALDAGYYTYNPLLAGLSLGYLCEITPPVLLAAALAGIFALVTTAVLARTLVAKLRLPILSLPFAVTASLVWLIALRYANLLPPTTRASALLTGDLGLPVWFAGLFKSFGALLFAPGVLPGLLLSLLVLRYSRILFLLGVAGYYLGTLLRGLLLGSLHQALLDSSHLNFYLIAMAVGGVFLVPSLRSGLVAMVAVAAGVLVLQVFAAGETVTGVPPLTFPFCLVTVVTIAVLRLVRSPLTAPGFGRTPEEVRENSLVSRLRYRGDYRTLVLPFSGKWTVWQGFDGRWTHQGTWRHAYDFVIVDQQGQTHRSKGSQFHDYYCYRMPVLSPVAGRVVRVVDNLADNPLGTVAGHSNWGNYVVLHDPRGFYVELSHFTPHSIHVKEGDKVERGSILGLCGNSGYSPQPHVHVQVQGSETHGADTLPFSFVSYACGDCYHANDLPREKEQVEPLYLEKRLDEATSFVVDDLLQYDVLRGGRPTGRFTLRVGIALDGTHYLESDRARLYFGKHDGTFYFYRVEGDDPYLQLFLLALPRLPLAYRSRLQWHDYVPISLVTSGLRRAALRLGSLVCPPLASVKVAQSFGGRSMVQSTAQCKILGLKTSARVEMDGQSGMARVALGDVELRRVSRPEGDVLAADAFQKKSRTRSTLMIACGILSLAALTTAVGIMAETKVEPKVRQAVQQSIQYEKSKDYPKAIATILDQYPAHGAGRPLSTWEDYTINLRLGWLYYLNGSYADAGRRYQAAIQASPGSLEAKQGRLLTLLAAENYKEAETLAREILKDDPKSYYANLRLAVAQRHQQKSDQARRIVESMLVAYPADVLYLAELARLPSSQVSSSPAGATPSLAGDPTYREALQKSLQFETSRKYAEAVAALAEPYAAHPRDYTLNLRLGWLYYLAADHGNSARNYHKALDVAPRSIEAGLGYLLPLLAQGRFKDAGSLAAQIVQGDPGNYFGNVRLAFALRLQGRCAEAEKIVRRMLVAYPTSQPFMLERGMLDLAENQREAAKEVFSDVLMLDPDNATAKEQLRGL